MKYGFITQLSHSLLIESVENGYVLSWQEEMNDGTYQVRKEIIEEPDDEDGEKVSMRRMLERAAEHFGCVYNKYVKNNLRIEWDKKGHKLE